VIDWHRYPAMRRGAKIPGYELRGGSFVIDTGEHTGLFRLWYGDEHVESYERQKDAKARAEQYAAYAGPTAEEPFPPTMRVRYVGRVWDIGVGAWDTLLEVEGQKALCIVVHHEHGDAYAPESLRVRLARWPDEDYEYSIFDLADVEAA
jgi:hypothetical protein